MSIKNKILVYIFATIISGLAIIFLVILPAARDIVKLNESVRLERIDLEKKYQRGLLLRKTISNFQEVKPYEERLFSIFVISGRELDFITSLEKIAADNSLTQTIKLNAAEPDKGAKTEIYRRSTIDISLQGRYPEIIKYLNDLEFLPYQVNINSINVLAKEGSVTADLKGEIFIVNETEI